MLRYSIESLLALQASVLPLRKSGGVVWRKLRGRLRRAVDCDRHVAGTERPPLRLTQPERKTRRKRRGGRSTDHQRRKTSSGTGLAADGIRVRELRRGVRAATMRETCYQSLDLLRSKERARPGASHPGIRQAIEGELRVLRTIRLSRGVSTSRIDYNLGFAQRMRVYFLRYLFTTWQRLTVDSVRSKGSYKLVVCPCEAHREGGDPRGRCALTQVRFVRNVAPEPLPEVEDPREVRRPRGKASSTKHRRCPGCQQRLVHLPFCQKKDKIKLPRA